MLENSKGQNRQQDRDQRDRMDQRDQRDQNMDTSSDRGRQNASANRGGTTDLSEDALTTDRDTTQRRGSGATTKNNVTGSDFDGQVSGE